MIVKKDEEVDYAGMIVHGSACVWHEYKNLKDLSIGDTIGMMYGVEFTQRSTHPYSIKAKTDGIIAIIPLPQIKMLVKSNPKEVSYRN